MKFYSGMVISEMPPELLDYLTDEGVVMSPDDDGFRHLGAYHRNPLAVVVEWVKQENGTVTVTYEETVDGDAGSLGDIFTVFTYEDGDCVNVETEWIAC